MAVHCANLDPFHVLRNEHIAPGHVRHLFDFNLFGLCNLAVFIIGVLCVVCFRKAGFKPTGKLFISKGSALNNGIEAVGSDVNFKLCKNIENLGYRVGTGAVACKEAAKETGVDFIRLNGLSVFSKNRVAVSIGLVFILVSTNKELHEPVDKFIGNNNFHNDIFNCVKSAGVILFNGFREGLLKHRDEEIHEHRDE